MLEASTNLTKFYRHWLQNNFKSEKQGRPVGDEFDYVEIRGLGQDKSVVKRKATIKDQAEYPREWDLYQRGLEQTAEGTPLREWPVMTHDEILRLNSHNIHTIEALIVLSDAGLQEIGQGARQLQQRAKAYLEEDAPKAAAANLKVRVDELAIENDALQTRIGRLDAENKELRALQEAEELPHDSAEPPKRGPGRPKKDVAA